MDAVTCASSTGGAELGVVLDVEPGEGARRSRPNEWTANPMAAAAAAMAMPAARRRRGPRPPARPGVRPSISGHRSGAGTSLNRRKRSERSDILLLLFQD